MELYTDGEAWYLAQEGERSGWRWRREGEEWALDRAALSPGAVRARLEELPASLQEELLAFAARAAAMGTQS